MEDLWTVMENNNVLKSVPAGFHGNHPKYSKWVENKLNAIIKRDGLTPDSVKKSNKRCGNRNRKGVYSLSEDRREYEQIFRKTTLILITMDSLYREIELSWDERLLGKRAAPQSVKILTPDFFSKYYPRLADWDWKDYLENKDSFYDRIPKPLRGKMDYKNPLDYMGVYFYRPGMEACVSWTVKKVFDDLSIDSSQYKLIPIEIDNTLGDYYVLFYPFTGLFEDSGVIWSQCLFVDDSNGEEYAIKGKEDYLVNLRDPQKEIVAKRIVLPSRYRSYDVINLWHSCRCFLSARLASSLCNILGTEMITPDRKSFCELVFTD